MDFLNQFPLRFYLNLGRRDERRAQSERDFHEAGIEVERFPAIDYRWLKSKESYETRQRRACALSHRLAVREAKKRKAEAVVIFEDDVCLAPDFLKKLEEIDLPDDWQILYLGCTHLKRPEIMSHGIVRAVETCDAHAYVIRANCYDRFLAQLRSKGNRVEELPAFQDCRISLFQKEIPVYACYPNLAWQRICPSDNLGFPYTNYDDSGEQKCHHEAIEGLTGETLGVNRYMASHQSGSNESTSTPEPKVAFLFLTRGDHHRPELWESYLDGYADQRSVYVHAKNPEQITHPLLSRHLLKNSIPTEWGDVSLVRATLLLLKEALKDHNNTHFILASESCIPIKPFPALIDLLLLDPRSWITDNHPMEFRETDTSKYQRFDKSLKIPPAYQAIQSQWMLLNREVAEIVSSVDLTTLFENHFAPDESYFRTYLKLANFPDDQIVNERITWSRWNSEEGHPESFSQVEDSLKSEIFRSPSFFARKF